MFITHYLKEILRAKDRSV